MSYLEGCTAPQRDENQLHAAVVELVALDDAQIKYSTVQNWYPGDENGEGGIYNFVTKRGDCRGAAQQDLLDPGRDRLGDHLEISELHPARRRFRRRVLLGGADPSSPAGRYRHQDDPHRQAHQVDHRRKGISAGHGQQSYRGLVRVLAERRRRAQLHPVRFAADRRASAARIPSRTPRCAIPARILEHEATTSKIGEDQLFYRRSRGISEEDAVSMIVNGFCKQVFRELPMEFAVEAQKHEGLLAECLHSRAS